MWLISPDSYKGTLSAIEAAEAIARGVDDGWPGKRCGQLPLGDGGEGTVAALTAVVGGVRHEAKVCDPLGREVTAEFSILSGGEALMEMASASGLMLLRAEELDPLRADTYGTGQLLAAAAERADRVTLGIGGSATVDGGIGLGRALGFRFLDGRGREVTGPGPDMRRVSHIDARGAGSVRGRLRVLVMCDVNNPLTGEAGAARVFGPQKGADAETVEVLEAGLTRLGEVLEQFSGKSICDLPGAGAAGGLGAALVGLLDAELVSGAQRALDLVQFERRLGRGVELVLTGEGSLDAQSLSGKLPVAVARRARKMGIPTVALPGRQSEGCAALRREFAAVVPACTGEAEPGDSRIARKWLREAAGRAAHCVRLGAELSSRGRM